MIFDLIDYCILIVGLTIGLCLSTTTNDVTSIYLIGAASCAIINNLIITKHIYESENNIAE